MSTIRNPSNPVRHFLLWVCISIVVGTHPSVAQAEFTPRIIYAIYDSSEAGNSTITKNKIHQYAEMPLNYLGYRVMLHDIQDGIPSDEMSSAAAVLTWFTDDRMKDPEAFIDWMERVVKKNIRIIMIERPGFLTNEQGDFVSETKIKKIFEEIGFDYGNKDIESAILIELLEKNSSMIEFERTIDGEIESYLKVNPIEPESTEVYLALKLKGIEGSESTPVAITRNSAIILGNYAVYVSYEDERAQWRIDPFTFFSKALSDSKRPKYDTTTRLGKRIFYSHIDGDGFRNIYYPDPTKICGEIIFEEILKKYTLPITVSFITSELEENYFGTKKLRDLAREILTLKNVEPAVHAFSHPLDWKKKITAFQIRDYSYPISSSEFEELYDTTAYKAGFVITASDEAYIEKEVDGAIDFINGLLEGTGKQVQIYLWSGNTSPNEETLKRVADHGVLNMNGGDSRFDSWNHSYTAVAALTRQQGEQIQVYSSNSNENIYTHGWTGPFYGYASVIQTFQNTEQFDESRNRFLRVSPINVYYHFYIGDRKASLKSLRTVYDYVIDQDIHPVFASTYAEIVEGFMSGKIDNVGDGSWIFSNYKKCRTVRFDDVLGMPDLDKSQGIDGFYKIHNTTYVHLANQESAHLYWTLAQAERMYLSHADADVDDLSISADTISYSTTFHRVSSYTFANVTANQNFELRWMDEQENLLQTINVVSNDDGTLVLKLDHAGSYKIKVVKI